MQPNQNPDSIPEKASQIYEQYEPEEKIWLTRQLQANELW